MTASIGHNRGPSLESGHAFRRYAWTKSRHALIKTVPLEILRGRIRRARELGLDYKTYACVRAGTGRDVIGFLFSSNALRPRDAKPEPVRAQKLGHLMHTRRIAMIHAPEQVTQVLNATPALDAGYRAPRFTDSWSVMRDQIKHVLRDQNVPGDGVLVIGETALDREWADAGRTAGYLTADRFFGTHP